MKDFILNIMSLNSSFVDRVFIYTRDNLLIEFLYIYKRQIKIQVTLMYYKIESDSITHPPYQKRN